MTQTTPEGVAWLNPNNLPAGCQVTTWDHDDEGADPQPVTLETRAHHTEMTRADAERLGRALLAAAHAPAPDAREQAAFTEVRDELRDHMANLSDKQLWDNRAMFERLLAALESATNDGSG